jgi:hypothetical protein
MAFNGTDIDDLDVTTPVGASDTPSTLDDAIREIKTVLKNQYAVISKSGAYTATTSDSIILCDASGGAFTITLPAVATVSSSTDTKEYIIIKIDSSANAVTIDGDGAETIDGAATTAVNNQYGAKTVWGNGTEWFTAKIDEVVDTAQLASGAVTEPKLEDFVAGDTHFIWGLDDDVATGTGGAGSTMLKCVAQRPGEFRLRVEVQDTGAGSTTISWKKNGSAESTTVYNDPAWAEQTYDMTVAAKDVIEIFVSAAFSGNARNAHITTDVFPIAAVLPYGQQL